MFPRVCSYNAPLSGPKTFVNIVCSKSLPTFSIHWYINHLISGLVLARPSLNHSFLSWNDSDRNIRSLTMPSFRVHLPKTVWVWMFERRKDGTICQHIRKKFLVFTSSATQATIVETIVERRLSLHYVSAVLPIARDWALKQNKRVNLWSDCPTITACQDGFKFYCGVLRWISFILNLLMRWLANMIIMFFQHQHLILLILDTFLFLAKFVTWYPFILKNIQRKIYSLFSCWRKMK